MRLRGRVTSRPRKKPLILIQIFAGYSLEMLVPDVRLNVLVCLGGFDAARPCALVDDSCEVLEENKHVFTTGNCVEHVKFMHINGFNWFCNVIINNFFILSLSKVL